MFKFRKNKKENKLYIVTVQYLLNKDAEIETIIMKDKNFTGLIINYYDILDVKEINVKNF